MANTFISLLFAGAVASAVQVGFGPAATSYIYRSDNNGPASLIQLGGHGYQQPHAFAPPIPIAQPLKYTEAFDLAPAPLLYVAAKPIVVEDAEDDDDSDEGSEEGGNLVGLDHGHSFEKGGGSDFGEKHHAEHGEKGSKGYNSKGHDAKGASGHYGKEHKEGHYEESKGKKGAHHDEADAHGKHHEAGESYKGGDHGHKKHFSKGEEVTGYHKVFNKDEFKKDHDFYDVADKSGHFNKHGYEKGHHGSEEGAHKEGGLYKSGQDKGEFGKAGFHSKGHLDDGEAGHSAEEGHDSHYDHEKDFGKKGGSSHEKEYEYADDDDDDEDDYEEDETKHE